MSIPNTNGVLVHKGYNCSPSIIPTAQSIPMSPSDSTTVKDKIENLDIGSLSDITISSTQDGQSLIYNGVSSKWENGTVPYATSAGNASTVNNLTVETAVPSGAVFTDTTYNEATTTSAGLMSATDKVKLDGIESGAEVNVQSDWNAVSGDALILNKPTIPAAQVNSDWSASSGVSEILNKPTTLSGYGITDAKITSGTITLGNNTITPLTQHQSVTDNNPTLAWGAKSKVATIGSTEINVTMPANPDTNTTYTFADGTNGFTVTPSGGTAQTVTVTPDLDMEKSASGSVVSFNDGGDNIPVKSFVTDIAATQAGSGTPSPSNVRTISGFDNVEIVRNGENIWSEEWEQGLYSSSGNKEANTNAIRAKNPIPVKSGESYVIVGLSANRVCYYDKSGTFVSTVTNQTVITIPNNVFFMTFSTGTSYGGSYNNDISINYPSTDTAYHAYKGTTYTISLGSTVYGGTLDVTNGELIITHGIVTDLGSQYWVIHSAGDYIFRTTIEGIKQPSSTDRNKDILCSCYKPSSVTAINSTMDNDGMLIANGNLYIRDTSYSDATAFKTSLNNQSFVYPLATPVVINLTKTQVTTLLNENIIYANSGNISIDYFTQSGKEISDIANSSNKMDFSNPTGVGSLSLNRADGTTIGNYSVALGVNCDASGLRSYAEGYNTKASGSVSHAAGRSTIANHWAQYVFGAYNIEDPSSASSSTKGNYIEIVGNGTSTTPSNARTLDWNGNETLAGDLTINGNVSVGDAITLDTSGTASRRITDISVTRSKIVKFNGIKFFNATIKANAAVTGGTAILDVSTGFESASQQSLLVTASTGGTIQAYIQSSTITTTNASALVTDAVYYIIGWYT